MQRKDDVIWDSQQAGGILCICERLIADDHKCIF